MFCERSAFQVRGVWTKTKRKKGENLHRNGEEMCHSQGLRKNPPLVSLKKRRGEEKRDFEKRGGKGQIRLRHILAQGSAKGMRRRRDVPLEALAAHPLFTKETVIGGGRGKKKR